MEKSQRLTTNTRLKLLQYNWLMETYITPVKRNKYSNNIPDTCSKCNYEQGTFIHCVWEWKKHIFWKEAFNKIRIILSINVPLDLNLMLMHWYPTNLKLRLYQSKLVDLAIIQAKWSKGTVFENKKGFP